MAGAEHVAPVQRFRREDYSRTRHDPHFSNWQVLIGPNDWGDYLEGIEGVARYRLPNLPNLSSPGLYELGVAVYPSDLGREIGKLNPKRIVVTYLGQADSVRARLQQYGRSGAHLGGYFADIFSKGYPIVFRWAPLENKADAQKTEAELLNTFDYAWNKGCNGSRRPEDILKKSDEVFLGRSSLLTNIVKILPYRQKRVGIKIKTSQPLSLDHEFDTYADEKIYDFLSQIFKFNRSQPRLVVSGSDTDKDDIVICGVIISDGSICSRSPVEGKKRCAEHKGMKTKELILTRNTGTKSQMSNAHSESIAPSGRESEGCGKQSYIFNPIKVPLVLGDYPVSKLSSHPICGFIFDDGSPCIRHPMKGRKRCDEHKGSKISNSKAVTDRKLQYVNDAVSDSGHNKKTSEMCIPGHVVNKGCDIICGVELGNGFVCMRQPVSGRVRCEEHRGLKITGLLSNLTATNKTYVSEVESKYSARYDQSYSNTSPICGATTCNGSPCRRPVNGNSRCWQHSVATNKRYVSAVESKCSARYDQSYSNTSSICGATTRNGSLCSRPVKGNSRCWQHCVAMNKSYVSDMESKYNATYNQNCSNTSSICGATTRNGSLCRRPVKGNRRCWQH